MNRPIRSLIATLFGLVVLSNESSACSWGYVIEESDERVPFIGMITGHTSESIDGRQATGVVVTPLLIYPPERLSKSSTYSIFPYSVGPICEPHYWMLSDGLMDHYQVGNLVSVIAYTNDPAKPGDLALAFGGGLDVLPDRCSLLRFFAIEFAQASSGSPECGSELFHAYKDLALLRSAASIQRVEILQRLSNSHYFTYFERLVERYVEDQQLRRELTELQYGTVIEMGCNRSVYSDLSSGRSSIPQKVRIRWGEYCTDERQVEESDGL